MLYPAELRDHFLKCWPHSNSNLPTVPTCRDALSSCATRPFCHVLAALDLEPSYRPFLSGCSIQLSYATIFVSVGLTRTQTFRPPRLVGMLYPAELRDHFCECWPPHSNSNLPTVPTYRDALSS